MKIKIIGAGLAGAEAAIYLAERGVKVRLYDIKPRSFTPAHSDENFGELVCSNSLKGNDPYSNACGLLKEEMRRLGSFVIEAADATRIPAGGALAVERGAFSRYITERIKNHPNIEVICEEVKTVPEDNCIIATGPLTTDALSESISAICGGQLHFYDASAPIVSKESIDFTKCFYGDRYGKGDDDYINCPMNKEEYENFVDAVICADKVILHDFEKREIFEGCMPVEVLAARGRDSLRFAMLKPVGLTDENGNKRYDFQFLNKRGSAIEKGERLGHGLQPRRFSDQPEIRRTEEGLFYDTRACQRGVSALRGYAPQHLHKFPVLPERGFFA